MKLAVIPARGGSKRIPRKNIRNFADRPIIAYSIEAALNSGLFDKVVVSTDDDEVAAIARQYGAEVPFVRPSTLADDYVGTGEVTWHAYQWCLEQGLQVEFICCIYATAPFLKTDDLLTGWQTLCDSESDYAFSVTEYNFPVQRSMRMAASGKMEVTDQEAYAMRSQDLEPMYHDAAQFYWSRTSALGKRGFSGNMVPVILPAWRVHDIDSEADWRRAELVYMAMQMSGD